MFCWVLPTGLVMDGCEDEEMTLSNRLDYPPVKELIGQVGNGNVDGPARG